jgi:CRISPR-associated protein Cas1
VTAADDPAGLHATLAEVADPGRLASAWADVLASDLHDGALGTGAAHFAQNTEAHLAEIATQLAAGTYRPGWLTPVALPRPDGQTRLLHVPTVRDRVVERSVLAVVTPVIDPWLGPFSYAYRPGLGVADAAQAIARLRDEGLHWVARADFRDYFGAIPVPRLRRMLAALIEDGRLLDLIETFLVRQPTPHSGGPAVMTGLPQGSPLSPLWANLVLTDFDSGVVAAGFPLVRYSDDAVALAASRDEAWEAMRVMSEQASELGMTLGADKSAVMSFEEGFSFVGEDFGPRYPPALDGHRVAEPDRRVLYIAVQGAHARLEAGRLIVDSPEDAELLNVPSGQVERIVSFGAVGISAGLRSWALASEVDLVFLSRRGTYLGHGWPAAGRQRIARLRAQFSVAGDSARALPFARAVVDAKVRKQMILLQRFIRRDNHEAVREAVRQIGQLLTMLPECTTTDETMGIEGAAAREYFGALGHLVPEDMAFAGRSRQPPEDLINAALSYGYAIILSEAVSALCAAGLDPAVGMFHAEQDRRPSLALDLMEEFRPLVVDQVVIAAARRGELRPEHGHRVEGDHGVLLTRAGREALVSSYERRMLQHTRGALPGLSGSLRRHLYRQAQRIAAYIEDPEATWTGLAWR